MTSFKDILNQKKKKVKKKTLDTKTKTMNASTNVKNNISNKVTDLNVSKIGLNIDFDKITNKLITTVKKNIINEINIIKSNTLKNIPINSISKGLFYIMLVFVIII